MKPPIENKIYSSIIGACEAMEHDGTYKGNGHHLAQHLTTLVSISLLPRNQIVVYACLTREYQTAKEISKLCGIPTKNVSVILKQINQKTLLVSLKKLNYRRTSYCLK